MIFNKIYQILIKILIKIYILIKIVCHVVSRIMVGPLTGVKVNILIFQKTIPNHLIILVYFFCWYGGFNFEQTLNNF